MANITLGTLRDYWKNVSDWVKGTDASSSPKVTVSAALPAGDNNIGDVDVISLPSLPAGDNNIGNVDVLTIPATNIEGIALASAARTATISSPDLENNWGKGIHVVLDVTEITSTPSITLKIEGKVNGKYYTILEGAAVTTVSVNTYRVFPHLTAVANSIANDVIPKTFRITVTHANTNSITYSVGYSLI